MSAIAYLIADPSRTPLDPKLVTAAAAAIGGEVRWLADDEAAEILTSTLAPAAAQARLEPILARTALDWTVLPDKARRKRLLISDMDSTIITIECIDELADFAGIKPEIAAITQRAMNGELDFAAALRERVGLLAGLPASTVGEVIRDRLRLMPGARTLVQTMRAAGATSALVSGGFTGFTGPVREMCGFDLHVSNELEIEGGKLTGRLIGPLHGAETKLATLRQLERELGLAADESLAVGDGANDLPMLKAAGLGVAFRAHAKVRAEIPVQVSHGDLTALLYLQGFARTDFVTS